MQQSTIRFFINGLMGLLLSLCPATAVVSALVVHAQTVEDGSDVAIGQADTRTIMDLIRQNLKNASDAKVSALRRSKGSIVCGSVNVKGKDGLYLGERGFVVDLSTAKFGRVPDGPELLNPRAQGFEDKERIRELYFDMCLE